MVVELVDQMASMWVDMRVGETVERWVAGKESS